MAGFTEKGFKLEASVAGTMAGMLPAAGPAGAAIATVIGGVAFIMEVLEWLENDTSVQDALRDMQKQIDGIIFVLNLLDQRMDELVNQVAIESNRQTNRDLLDYLDEIRTANLALQSPARDLEAAVRTANEAGITLDKFIRNDFDIWRWTDVVSKDVFNPQTGSTHAVTSLAPQQFKHLPTLPVYAMAVLTWLAAREKVVQLGAKERLDDDAGRIARHLAAVSVRPGFDKYADGELGAPESIAENIKWQIRAFAIAGSAHPVNRVCNWFFEVQNWMDGDLKRGDHFDLTMESDHVLCTVDPATLGAPSLELDAESASGIDMLQGLAETLEHVSSAGTLKKPFIGQFPTTEVYAPAVLYVIAQNADLHWYRNEEASRPGGSAEWKGPVKIGNGWGDFTSVFSGGGAAVYGIRPDGKLMWYGHDGFFEGTGKWRGEPREVGHGWQGFKSVFSGGEHVIYGIQPNGDLIWYRHDGASYGGDVTTWAPSVKVGNGWGDFVKVFSGGGGVIYAIRQDGVLERHVHTGYLQGTLEWEARDEIGTGWNGFQAVVAAGDGVIYAFTRDGKVLWYRYGKRKKPAAGTKWDWKHIREIAYLEPAPTRETAVTDAVWKKIRFTDIPVLPDTATDAADWKKRQFIELERNPLITELMTMTWEGPVEIKRGLPGFRSVFPLMNAPFRGPN
ncbi:tachylectin-related carbohydrate-binding protein [Paenibacillus arenilitoris]|uniref:Tachylectin 2 domain-containing protein n=1 Tax=Paenibacillus arenilitoris TaxID=2772299 RepID=A0A927H4X1_9BACL|nr:tachylectin-related carbohydrate-binding protein [Paenibacillus arenilitoris]MBD2867827.1 hypothetical protein [Paenibacillus arenilitoris]